MRAPLLLDLSHTCHTRARTGIQRVTRSMWSAFSDQALAITHDPHGDVWRELAAWERKNLGAAEAAAKRSAAWPIAARIGGRTRRILGRRGGTLPQNSGLVVPEVFSPVVARALPALFAAVRGPKVALFHDAIALKLPELAPAKTVGRFPAYLTELLAFDGIAAVSEDSAHSLADYWRWLGAKNPPQIRAIALGVEPVAQTGADETKTPPKPPVVLSVGSIEGRKNHLALLEACENLWSRKVAFSLHLVGLAQPQTGRAALERIRALQAAGRPLRYDGPVSDARLDDAYRASTFTVYPSLIEGFGLPVIESLAHGKPCVCSGRGALGESARGGGCVMLDHVDRESIEQAMGRLLSHPAEIVTLSNQARARRFKTWRDYTIELTDWMRDLPTR